MRKKHLFKYVFSGVSRISGKEHKLKLKAPDDSEAVRKVAILFPCYDKVKLIHRVG